MNLNVKWFQTIVQVNMINKHLMIDLVRVRSIILFKNNQGLNQKRRSHLNIPVVILHTNQNRIHSLINIRSSEIVVIQKKMIQYLDNTQQDLIYKVIISIQKIN